MIELSDSVRRLDCRDDFKLISYVEVGIPVYRLNASITLQEISPVSAIEEFVLRSIEANVASLTELESFLGLPSNILISQLGQMCYEGLVTEESPETRIFRVASSGRKRLQDASTAVFKRQRMPLYIDGITRKLTPLRTEELWREQDLLGIGIPCISPSRKRYPSSTDIDVGQINRLLDATSPSNAAPRRAVQIDAIVGRPVIHYRRAVAVAFKSSDGRSVSIAFVIDGRVSEDHEVEYAKSGAAKESAIFGPIFESNRRRREAQAALRELKADVEVNLPADGSKRLLRLPNADAGRAKAVGAAKTLSVYEHPPLLVEALETSKSRVLIVSPWIRASVVDVAFVKRLTACLDRGVQVTIAYGISRRDTKESGRDKAARESLIALSQSFENFRFVLKGNTHAKILLVDDRFFVTTSFNWLSFNGDPSLPMREEEGTLVEGADAVNDYFDLHIKRLSELPK